MELKIVDCGNDERLFRRLLEEPFAFDQATYERLVDRFRSRLDIDDLLSITAKRLRQGLYADPLERRTEEADRLLDILERRDRAGLRVPARGPAFPPRSS